MMWNHGASVTGRTDLGNEGRDDCLCEVPPKKLNIVLGLSYQNALFRDIY